MVVVKMIKIGTVLFHGAGPFKENKKQDKTTNTHIMYLNICIDTYFGFLNKEPGIVAVMFNPISTINILPFYIQPFLEM